MFLDSFQGDSVSQVVKRVSVNLTAYHSSKQGGESLSFYLWFSPEQLRHHWGRRLAYRAAVSSKRYICYLIVRELNREWYLIAAERVVQIHFAIRI
jgi:hypothetical protein